MFCPKGYVVFGEVERTVDAFVSEVIPMDFTRATEILKLRSLAARLALSEFIMNCPSISLASATGVRSVEPRIGRMYERDDGSSVWAYLDPGAWKVDAPMFERRLFAASAEYRRLVKQHLEAEKHDQAREDRLAYLDMIIQDAPTIRLFSQFDGWVLTCMPKHLPKSLEEFQCLRELCAEPRSARLQTPEDVAEDIIRRYDADEDVRNKILWPLYRGKVKYDVYRDARRSAVKERPALEHRRARSKAEAKI